jgi:hypothetical protein
LGFKSANAMTFVRKGWRLRESGHWPFLVVHHGDNLNAKRNTLDFHVVGLFPRGSPCSAKKSMRGSWSIKSAMPTIDSRLAYELLDGLASASGACDSTESTIRSTRHRYGDPLGKLRDIYAPQ